MESCQPAAARLFEMLLNEGARRGHEVAWWGTSFSIRAHEPGGERKWSFLYGYTNNQLQFYFVKGAPWSQGEDAAAFRTELLESGFFLESGRLTLKCTVDEKNADGLRDLAPRIFTVVESSISRFQDPDGGSKG